MSSKSTIVPPTTVKLSDIKAATVKAPVPKTTVILPTKSAQNEPQKAATEQATKVTPAAPKTTVILPTKSAQDAPQKAATEQATKDTPAAPKTTVILPTKSAQNEPQKAATEQPTKVTPRRKSRPVTGNPTCPRCQTVLTVHEGKLPELCPTCNFILRARRQKAFNHNFELAFRKTFVWRGRATRREFWGFAIIMGALGLLLALALDILCNGYIAQLIAEYIAPIPALPELLWYILTPMLGAALLIWVLALPLPLLSLTIRRLHDVGRSMLWLTVAGICWLGAALATSVSAISMLLALLCGADATAAETAPIAALIEHSLEATLVLGGLATIFTLAIGMFSLMDSQRGSNKYGPSAKYPLE